MDTQVITEMMKDYIAQVISVSPADVDENENFFHMGISSIQALKIINKIRKQLNADVELAAMFEYKCVSELAVYLSGCTEAVS